MPRLLLAVACAALLGLALWLLSAPERPPSTLDPTRAPSANAPMRAEAQRSSSDRAELPTTTPSPSDALPNPDPKEANAAPTGEPLEYVITGTCTDEFDNPLAGVDVRLNPFVPIDDLVSEAPLHALSDAEGRYNVRLTSRSRPTGLHLRWQGTDQAPRQAFVTWNADVREADLGSVRLFQAMHITGRAIDRAGLPVVDVWLAANRAPLFPGAPHDAEWEQIMRAEANVGRFELPGVGWIDFRNEGLTNGYASSDETGAFQIDVLNAGEWLLEVVCDSHDFVRVQGGSSKLPIHLNASVDLTLLFQARETITGQILGERPDDAQLSIHASNRDLKPGEDERASTGCRSHPDGSFVLFRDATLDDVVDVTLQPIGAFRGLAPVTARWGDEITLTVVSRPTLRIEVHDAATDQPLQDFTVLVPGESLTRFADIRAAQTGVVEFIGPEDQPVTFDVVAPAPYAAAGPFQATPSQAPFIVRLAQAPAFDVDVTTADGQPVAGATVQLVGLSHAAYNWEMLHYQATDSRRFARPDSPLIWAEATTDAAGQTTLRHADLTDRFWFVRAVSEAKGRGGAPLPTQASRVAIQLAPSAEVRVELKGDWPPIELYLSLVQVENDVHLYPNQNALLPPANASSFSNVPAGVWDVRFAFDKAIGRAQVLRTDGHTTQTITLDADQLITRGRDYEVELDGAPLVSGFLDLNLPTEVKSGMAWTNVRRLKVVNGQVTLPDLPTARYPIELEGSTAKATLDVRGDSAIHLATPAQ